MVRVGGQGRADDLGEDRRAAVERVLGRLDDEDAGALAEHEAVAGPIERARGALGIVVALRQRAHVRERRERHRQERRLGAAREDDVALARAR